MKLDTIGTYGMVPLIGNVHNRQIHRDSKQSSGGWAGEGWRVIDY